MVARYTYQDEDGQPLFQVRRWEPGLRGKPKSFTQHSYVAPGRWGRELNGAPPVLYRLPKVRAAVDAGCMIYVVEGEKDVQALEAAGVVATCNPAGVGKWRSEFSEVLLGAKVVIVADKDDQGRKHARMVFDDLRRASASTSLPVRSTDLSVVEAKEGKDAADHLAAGCGLEDFVPVDPRTLPRPAEKTEPKVAPTEKPVPAVVQLMLVKLRRTYEERGIAGGPTSVDGKPNEWESLCPAHDDSSPSLRIGVGTKQRAVVHCFTEDCTAEDVARALGIDPLDLMTQDTNRPYADEILAVVQRQLLLELDDAADFYDELTSEEDLDKLPDVEWVIDGWIPSGGYSIVFGPSGIGKTLVLLGMAKGVSRGKRWQKATCRPGAVLFLQGEGLGQLKDRSRAWDEAYPRTGREKGIAFADKPLDLTKPEAVAQVIRTVRRVEEAKGSPVELVVVDPLAEFMTGNENLEGMAAASKSLRVLAQLLGCAVVVGHHTPQDGNRERGYTMLRDKALVSISVEHAPDGIGVVQRKSRNSIKRAISLHFREQGDSVIFEYDSDEVPADDYNAEKDRRIKQASENSEKRRALQEFNGQRALNIVRSVVQALEPGIPRSQNALVKRCLEAAEHEHAANPGFTKIGRTLLIGHIQAMAAKGEELLVDGEGQKKLYRSPSR